MRPCVGWGIALGFVGLLGTAPVGAQSTAAGAAWSPAALAAPADVSTIDSIVSVLYAVISGPVGQPRQWARFASLFHPQARLMPSHCDSAGRCDVRVLTPQEYRQRADSFLVKEGFTERQIAARTERFGNVAHVFSSYESFRRGETKPFTRGINSIQLVWDGRRWWVLSILWDSERPNNPLPPAYARPATSESARRAAAAADPSFAGVQQRGAQVMGVDQYTSTHVFEPLPDGGRIVLQRDTPDSAGTATIRAHMRHIAGAFAAGDFRLPGQVHATDVPGTATMAARRGAIRYSVDTLPRGAALRLQSSDSAAVRAIHEFLVFQRHDHRAGAHGAH